MFSLSTFMCVRFTSPVHLLIHRYFCIKLVSKQCDAHIISFTSAFIDPPRLPRLSRVNRASYESRDLFIGRISARFSFFQPRITNDLANRSGFNRNLTNRTSLMPGAVSPIDDQRLIGVCENVPVRACTTTTTTTTIGKRSGENMVTSGRKRGEGTFTRSSGKMDNRRRRNRFVVTSRSVRISQFASLKRRAISLIPPRIAAEY